MKLYEISESLRELWGKIAEQDGEVGEDDLQALNELELAKNDKLEGCGVLIREMTAEANEYSEESKRLKELQDRKKRAIERLKNYVQKFMAENSIEKFDSVKVQISFRKSKSLEIDDNVKLPKEFIRIKEEPDKTAITDFIKNGGTVGGCRLVEKTNIQIK